MIHARLFVDFDLIHGKQNLHIETLAITRKQVGIYTGCKVGFPTLYKR